MKISGLFAVSLFVILLVWGPINHSWQYFWVVHLTTLIVPPYLLFFLLEYLNKRFQLSLEIQKKIEKFFWTGWSVLLIIWAIDIFQTPYHFESTQVIRTRDGMEDVGDSVMLEGADIGGAFILIIMAMIILFFGVYQNNDTE